MQHPHVQELVHTGAPTALRNIIRCSSSNYRRITGVGRVITDGADGSSQLPPQGRKKDV